MRKNKGWCSRISDNWSSKLRKEKRLVRKGALIKFNTTSCIYSSMKTSITFVKRTVAKKQTFRRLKSKLVLIIWSQIGKASTTKYLEKVVIRFLSKKSFKRRCKLEIRCRKSVQEICG